MATADVTIYGAGVFGLAIAFTCLQRGAKVRVIDPNGVGAGASGGLVGALAPHTPNQWNTKKQFQFESLIHSRDFWPGVEVVSGLKTGYRRSGRLTPILQERQIPLAESRRQDAADNWQGLAQWSVVSAKSQGEWTPPSPTGLLVHDTLSAHIHPRLATQSLAQAVQELGGIITPSGARQGQVIEATGAAGLRDLSDVIGREIGKGEKGQAALLEFETRDPCQLFADGLHIIPHIDATVAIGSTRERSYKSADQTDGQLDDIIAKAKRLFPILADAPVIARWAGLRPRANTRAPLLGAHPTKPGCFVANGGFTIGFGMAPKIASVMADLVLDGIDTIPAEFSFQTLLEKE